MKLMNKEKKTFDLHSTSSYLCEAIVLAETTYVQQCKIESLISLHRKTTHSNNDARAKYKQKTTSKEKKVFLSFL
jgi:hypothetical protein